MVTKAQFFDELSKRAEAEKKPGESVAQAFARFADTDVGKVLMQAHKLAGGPDHQFERPVPSPVRKASPAMDKLMQLAAARSKASPELSPEQSFAAVYTDPANKDVVAGLRQQHRGRRPISSSPASTKVPPITPTTLRSAIAPTNSR